MPRTRKDTDNEPFEISESEEERSPKEKKRSESKTEKLKKSSGSKTAKAKRSSGSKVATKCCSKCQKVKDAVEFPYGKLSCRDCQRKQSREYKARNRDKMREYGKKYKAENREEISKYNHKYHSTNRKVIQERHNRVNGERKKRDPNYATSCKLRSKFHKFMSTGGHFEKSMQKLIGCSYDTLMIWLEYQFEFYIEEEMSESLIHKDWTIDHVNPCCNFDLTQEDQQLKCYNWTNLRPIECLENKSKNGKVDKDFIKVHRKVAEQFIREYIITGLLRLE